MITARPTQKMQVLDLLRQRSITALDTFELIRTMRLAAYIGFLRDDGYKIDSKIIKTPSNKRVALYTLVSEPVQGDESDEPTTQPQRVQPGMLFDNYPNGQGM